MMAKGDVGQEGVSLGECETKLSDPHEQAKGDGGRIVNGGESVKDAGAGRCRELEWRRLCNPG